MENRTCESCIKEQELTKLKIDVGVLQSKVDGVEKDICLIRGDISQLKQGMEKINNKIDTQFNWLVGIFITVLITGITLFAGKFM
jgi:hypothetical protein